MLDDMAKRLRDDVVVLAVSVDQARQRHEVPARGLTGR
jgi:hypothetical protein